MTAAPSNPETHSSEPAPSKGAGGLALLGTGLAGLIGLAVPPLALFVMIGFLPTVVARIVERPEQKNLAKCVGALNMSGVIVVGYYFATLGLTMTSVAKILGQPSLWAALYGPAAIGWGVCLAVPPTVQGFARRRLDRQRRILEIAKKRLVLEWGPEAAAGEGRA